MVDKCQRYNEVFLQYLSYSDFDFLISLLWLFAKRYLVINTDKKKLSLVQSEILIIGRRAKRSTKGYIQLLFV